MTSSTIAYNNLYNSIIQELRIAIQTAELMTDDLKVVIDGCEKKKTKAKKEKKPRFTGYLLFMSERNREVRAENPGISTVEVTRIVAPSWKELPKEKQDEYKRRAEEEKQKYFSQEKPGESVDSKTASKEEASLSDASSTVVPKRRGRKPTKSSAA
jgi:hypothetical protein